MNARRCPAPHPRVYLHLAAHSRVSSQLIGGIWSEPPRPNGSLEFETMSLASPARSDASSKAFMALFRGSASLFIRIGSFFYSSLHLSSLFIAASLRRFVSLFLSATSSFPSSLYHDIHITTRDVAR